MGRGINSGTKELTTTWPLAAETVSGEKGRGEHQKAKVIGPAGSFQNSRRGTPSGREKKQERGGHVQTECHSRARCIKIEGKGKGDSAQIDEIEKGVTGSGGRGGLLNHTLRLLGEK